MERSGNRLVLDGTIDAISIYKKKIKGEWQCILEIIDTSGARVIVPMSSEDLNKLVQEGRAAADWTQ